MTMLVASSEARRAQRKARESLHPLSRIQDDEARMAVAAGGDCEGPDAMLNFARHVFGYARYCSEMNA